MLNDYEFAKVAFNYYSVSDVCLTGADMVRVAQWAGQGLELVGLELSWFFSGNQNGHLKQNGLHFSLHYMRAPIDTVGVHRSRHV